MIFSDDFYGCKGDGRYFYPRRDRMQHLSAYFFIALQHLVMQYHKMYKQVIKTIPVVK